MTNVTYSDESASGQGKILVEGPGTPINKHAKRPPESPLDGPAEYTTKLNKRGVQQYFRNNTLVALSKIPPGTLIRDIDAEARRVAETVARSTEQAIKIAIGELKLSNKECLWQDGPGSFMRFVSGKMVYLCDEHYQVSNLGKVSHKLQERAYDESVSSAQDSPGETTSV